MIDKRRTTRRWRARRDFNHLWSASRHQTACLAFIDNQDAGCQMFTITFKCYIRSFSSSSFSTTEAIFPSLTLFLSPTPPFLWWRGWLKLCKCHLPARSLFSPEQGCQIKHLNANVWMTEEIGREKGATEEDWKILIFFTTNSSFPSFWLNWAFPDDFNRFWLTAITKPRKRRSK